MDSPRRHPMTKRDPIDVLTRAIQHANSVDELRDLAALAQVHRHNSAALAEAIAQRRRELEGTG